MCLAQQKYSSQSLQRRKDLTSAPMKALVVVWHSRHPFHTGEQRIKKKRFDPKGTRFEVGAALLMRAMAAESREARASALDMLDALDGHFNRSCPRTQPHKHLQEERNVPCWRAGGPAMGWCHPSAGTEASLAGGAWTVKALENARSLTKDATRDTQTLGFLL